MPVTPTWIESTRELPPAEPFILRDLLMAHGWLRLAPFSWDAEREVLHRVERLGAGTIVTLDIQALGGKASDTLKVQVRSESELSPSEIEDLDDRLRWMFCLDERLADFHATWGQEPGLRKAVRRRQGRLLRCSTVFEELIKTLCCVNTRWAQSVRMAERIVLHYGECHPSRKDLVAFPRPETIASADPVEFQQACRVGYRAGRMIGIARRVAEGSLDPERLKDSTQPLEEARELLLEQPGIGPYAAAHVLWLMGRHEELPIDSWAREVTRRAWFEGRTPTDAEIRAAFERFHPYQGLVYRCYDWDGANDGFRQQVEGVDRP